jgi:hypothetical protein
MSRAGGGRPTVESGITLDIRYLKRDALLQPGKWSGSWQWRWVPWGQLAAHVEYEADAEEEAGSLHIASVTLFDPFGRSVRMQGQTIRLVTTVPRFGGRRWWFICPSTGRRVMKLHLPYGARVFASRQAYGLGYAVQRESPRDKAYRRARKARHRIGGSDDLTAPLPGKPKWMRWPTYWRHVAACNRTGEETLEFLVASAERLLGRPIA